MCSPVPLDRKLIRGALDKEQDLRQMKNTFFLFHRYIVTMGELCAGGSTAEPDHIPTLEERVDTLSNQVILLISHFHESANKSVEMATPDDEVDGFFITQGREGER